MIKYPKIQTVFKRCKVKGSHYNKLIEGDWTLPEFELLKDEAWEASEKIDGTNIRVEWDGASVWFGGRTENANMPTSLVNVLINLFTKEQFKEAELPPMTLFGEGYGKGIQKVGALYKDGVDFAAFDIFCGGLWLETNNVEDICCKMGINIVPRLLNTPTLTLNEAIDWVKKGWITNIDLASNAPAEGLVLRASYGLRSRTGERLICKIKTRDFAKTISMEEAEALESTS